MTVNIVAKLMSLNDVYHCEKYRKFGNRNHFAVKCPTGNKHAVASLKKNFRSKSLHAETVLYHMRFPRIIKTYSVDFDAY